MSEEKRLGRVLVDQENEIATLTTALAERDAEIERLRRAFGHVHEASEGNIDTCKRCGFDIRDTIHSRKESPRA